MVLPNQSEGKRFRALQQLKPVESWSKEEIRKYTKYLRRISRAKTSTSRARTYNNVPQCTPSGAADNDEVATMDDANKSTTQETEASSSGVGRRRGDENNSRGASPFAGSDLGRDLLNRVCMLNLARDCAAGFADCQEVAQVQHTGLVMQFSWYICGAFRIHGHSSAFWVDSGMCGGIEQAIQLIYVAQRLLLGTVGCTIQETRTMANKAHDQFLDLLSHLFTEKPSEETCVQAETSSSDVLIHPAQDVITD